MDKASCDMMNQMHEARVHSPAERLVVVTGALSEDRGCAAHSSLSRSTGPREQMRNEMMLLRETGGKRQNPCPA